MVYELEEGVLRKIEGSSNPVLIPLTTIYQQSINDEYTLLINSFKNKVLIVESKKIKGNMMEFDYRLREWLDTPSSNKNQFSSDTLYNELLLSESKKKIQISLAITYSCNLRCSYCFQQNYDHLVRKPITIEALEKILDKISLILYQNPEVDVSIGLFGGEPLLPQNEKIIDRVFQYCVENKLKIDITTNGSFLPYSAKKIVIHRSIISVIAITINTLPDKYNETIKITKVANNVEELLAVTDLLLHYHIVVDVGTNFDRNNLSELLPIYHYFFDKGYFSKWNFHWNIGRVDDRLFDTGYDEYIVSETDILLQLMKIPKPVPSNLHAGFIQTCKNLTDKLNLSFNESQIKGTYHYCWNVSPYDRVFYIDNELNLFRCTVTVGRPQYILGNLKDIDLMNYQHETKSFLDYKDCQICHIGGFVLVGVSYLLTLILLNNVRWKKRNLKSLWRPF
ncbi:radical SAM/SPASM ryptide class RiPP maturase [Staphylococcus pseudintermedius]|uniref:radical SAM/SPASM ryptide class RiPP maturase n=1 Tax=Staphylococcus pseudintermedius TaxID=283734 RepID=UPI001F0D88C9|nr:radical SAM/SPASM ryptide class RiPP maturase [Staphylococcus pseudintermedius]